jgi:hypothetical protein
MMHQRILHTALLLAQCKKKNVTRGALMHHALTKALTKTCFCKVQQSKLHCKSYLVFGVATYFQIGQSG